MIPIKLKEKLKAQWGEKADTMEAICPCCLNLGSATIYPYAIDPMDEDKIMSIWLGKTSLYPNAFFSVADMFAMVEAMGKEVEIDEDFRPISAKILYEKLRKRYES